MSWTEFHLVTRDKVYLKGKPSEFEPVRVGAFYSLTGKVGNRDVFINPGMILWMEEYPDEFMCRCGTCRWVGPKSSLRSRPDDEELCPKCYSENIEEAERWS